MNLDKGCRQHERVVGAGANLVRGLQTAGSDHERLARQAGLVGARKGQTSRGERSEENRPRNDPANDEA